MENKISLKKIDKVHLKLNGSFDISVEESNDFVGIEYDAKKNDSCIIKQDGEIISFTADKEDSEWNDDIRESVSKLNFKNGLLNFLESTKPLIASILNKKKSQTVHLHLFLKDSGTKKLIIEADNVNVDFERANLQYLSIDADNCHIKSNNNFAVSKVDIQSDNLDATIHFGNNARFWTISSDNASVCVIREHGFNGQIRVKGDNKDISGRTDGNCEIGLCQIKADNVDLNIKG